MVIDFFLNSNYPSLQSAEDYEEAEYIGYNEIECGEVIPEDPDYIGADRYASVASGRNLGFLCQPHNLNASMPILASHLDHKKHDYKVHFTPQTAKKPRVTNNHGNSTPVKQSHPKNGNPVVEQEKLNELAKNSEPANDIGGTVLEAVSQSPKKFIRKFNDEIRYALEAKFNENNFISGVEKDQLAIKLNLTERQVKKW